MDFQLQQQLGHVLLLWDIITHHMSLCQQPQILCVCVCVFLIINPRMLLCVFCEIIGWFFDNFNAITLFKKKKKREKSIKTHFYILKCVQPICPILKSTILFRRFQKNWKTNTKFFYKWFLGCCGERCAKCGWWAVVGLLSFSISTAIAWTLELK